jgi:hypothetical protein
MLPKRPHSRPVGGSHPEIQEIEQKSNADLEKLEKTEGVGYLKKAIAEEYEAFKGQRFAKVVLEKNEELNNIIMSRLMLNDSIAYARLLFNRGRYEESLKIVNILYSIVYDAEDILNLLWAKLVGLCFTRQTVFFWQ